MNLSFAKLDLSPNVSRKILRLGPSSYSLLFFMNTV